MNVRRNAWRIAAMFVAGSLTISIDATAADDVTWKICIGGSGIPFDRQIEACARIGGNDRESRATRAAAYDQLGYAQLQRNKCRSAIAAYTSAIALAPGFYAFRARARACLQCSSYDLAIADYEEALKLQPYDSYTANELRRARHLASEALGWRFTCDTWRLSETATIEIDPKARTVTLRDEAGKVINGPVEADIKYPTISWSHDGGYVTTLDRRSSSVTTRRWKNGPLARLPLFQSCSPSRP